MADEASRIKTSTIYMRAKPDGTYVIAGVQYGADRAKVSKWIEPGKVLSQDELESLKRSGLTIAWYGFPGMDELAEDK